MKITAIELYHVSVPLKETFWPTWIPGYPQTHNRFTLIKIVTDDGIEGYSAGAAMGKERAGLGDLLGGYLMGADPADIDRVQSLLKQAGFLGWRNFWIEPACWYIDAHRRVFRQLGVPCEETDDGYYICKFTDRTVRAFQLLHVLLHELGHHHDRMSTRSKRQASRGEGFAERYALAYGDRIWERYLEAFGVP